MGLQAEFSMILEIDNQGALDLVNNLNVGGRTRHVDIRQNFLHELKENGILPVKLIPVVQQTIQISVQRILRRWISRSMSWFTRVRRSNWV